MGVHIDFYSFHASNSRLLVLLLTSIDGFRSQPLRVPARKNDRPLSITYPSTNLLPPAFSQRRRKDPHSLYHHGLSFNTGPDERVPHHPSPSTEKRGKWHTQRTFKRFEV